jgi:hypothetical protein
MPHSTHARTIQILMQPISFTPRYETNRYESRSVRLDIILSIHCYVSIVVCCHTAVRETDDWRHPLLTTRPTLRKNNRARALTCEKEKFLHANIFAYKDVDNHPNWKIKRHEIRYLCSIFRHVHNIVELDYLLRHVTPPVRIEQLDSH